MMGLLWQISQDVVLGAPGSFFLWAFGGFKGSYLIAWRDREDNSTFVGIVFWLIVAALFAFCAGVLD